MKAALARTRSDTPAVETTIDMVLITYPRRQIRKLYEADPSFHRSMPAHLAIQLVESHNHLVMLGRHTAKERLATLLLMVSLRNYGEDENSLKLPISLRDIADYLGLTVNKISCELQKLNRQSVISIEKSNEIALTNLEALQGIADGH
jgi:CRP/FNR family transcriptional regulator